MTRKQRKILIVDDSPEDRQTYKRYLLQDQRYSYEIWEEECGEEGLERCLQHQFDAIVLDFMLPDFDGLEFLKELHEREPKNHPPVAILTGQGNEKVAVAALKAGAEDYLVKKDTTPFGICYALDSVIERKQLQQKLARSQERRQLSAEIALRIRQCLNLGELLEATVTQVRQLLECDRVVVYQFKPDWSGEVVAESLGSGWTSALDRSINDICFQQGSGEDYRQGKTRAIANLYEANLSECHIKMLEQFEVKANLIVPILLTAEIQLSVSATIEPSPCRLWGLLIAHQCSDIRTWQTEELELLNDLAVQIAISIHQAQLFEKLQIELKERHKLEEEREQLVIRLQESIERFELAAAAVNCVIYDWDISKDIVKRTKELSQVLGYKVEETEPTRHWWNQRIHPDDLPCVREKVGDIFEPGDGLHYAVEYRIRRKDERYIHVLDCGMVLRDEKGVPLRVVGSTRDISDRKQAELEIRKSLEREKELNELKSRFVSMVSHEFRNPLNSIGGMAQMLQLYNETLPELKKQELFGRMQQGIERLVQLLDDVLVIGRADAGRLQFLPAPLEVEKFCRSLLGEVQMGEAQIHKIDFVYLGEKKAIVDEKLLRHILVNLLSNALKYSPEENAVRFNVSHDGHEITFEIEDFGIGIPAKDLPHLFDAFHRASNVKQIKGTGLGLAIVKQCVEIHGGQIVVQSEVGKGTIFTVTIPCS
ncbi:MAG: ATP-binding protein [Cyanobacteriota bacterium]|nr:ATP-binding protein [Cyanobacteriota bacterium]